ncbi:MAG: sigma-70 family RNA polymerase sigma factor [Planctomycetes bacterium]|nr:sigma-70 family RNA polymerase sigma factor [Planctomycetota bacterium]
MTCPPTDHPWPELIADLRRYVRRRVHDEHLAEDLVQDTLAKATAKLAESPPPGPLRAWLLRVAGNAIVDHHRRLGRDGSAQPTDEPVGADQGQDDLERRGLLASFRAFLQDLPAEQRDAVLQSELDGVSQAELATRLGLPLSTVKSRVQRGRKRLEQALRDCCTFEFDRRGRLVDWQRRPGGECRDC